MAKDKIIPFRPEKPDVAEMEVGGKMEAMLSARGVVLLCLSAWRLDKTPKALYSLRRYCEYISAHGYRGGAAKALAELESLDDGQAKAWIRRTYARYVSDQLAMVNYVMNNG